MFYFNFKFERVHCQLYIDRLGAKHCEALALGKRSIAGGDVCWHLRFVGFLHFFMVFIFIFSLAFDVLKGHEKKTLMISVVGSFLPVYFDKNIKYARTAVSFGSVAERSKRWFKAPVSSEAWVRIPPLPFILYLFLTIHLVKILMGKHKRFVFRCLISFQALNRSIVKAS